MSRKPDTVLAPDVSFVAKGRVPVARSKGFYIGAPDIAVEVISPGDSHDEVDEKVLRWLAAGTKAVLTINPRLSNITLYRSREEVRVFTGEQRLELNDLVPGWSIQVSEIFAE